MLQLFFERRAPLLTNKLRSMADAGPALASCLTVHLASDPDCPSSGSTGTVYQTACGHAGLMVEQKAVCWPRSVLRAVPYAITIHNDADLALGACGV